MALMNTRRWNRREALKNRLENPLIENFFKLEGSDVFPYNLAWDCFGELRNTTQSSEELLAFLIEDILFTSLYATYYEALLTTMHEFPNLSLELIDQFQEDAKSREHEINLQVLAHFNYIENGGHCDGCPHCEHHADVDEIIEHWQAGDMKFFVDLYIGMNTIQYAFENLIFDIIPFKESMISKLTTHNIIEFRKQIFAYAEHRLHQASLN